LLDRAVTYGKDRVAVAFNDSQLTFGELDERANRVADALRGLGVAPGDRVAVIMANRTEYLELYHGVGRLGAVLVPIVTQSKLPEIEYFVEHSEAVVMIVDGERWDVVAPGFEGRTSPAFRTIRHVLRLDAAGDQRATRLDQLLADASPAPPAHRPEPQDLVAFMYTSGSTGRPKAVMHSHYTAVAQADAVSERMGYTREDRIMTIFPLFHGNALVWSALAAAYAGARVILTERFSASGFWDQVRRYGATEVNLLVGATNMILAQPESPDDRDHPLKLVLATITQSVYDRFTERFGVDIVTTWALAEGPLGTMTAPGYGYRPGLIGWPMGKDNVVSVLDENDRELGPGEHGELVQRNAAVMGGYYKNDEETARVMRNGWVRSGDLGYRDEDGMFYFVGREKHVIRRSGENVSGEEVEDRLNAHPSVVEAAVIPVPDDIRGEEVKAYVVVRPGEQLTPEEIVAWCAEQLADFKVPRYVEFRDALPRTGPEKVKRTELKAEPNLTDCWDRRKVGG
jgi:crotonobetaine/carnitine-CoA ligase